MIEATLKIKNEETRHVKKYLIYDEDIRLSTEDPKIKDLVEKAMKEFDKCGVPDDVTLTIRMTF